MATTKTRPLNEIAGDGFRARFGTLISRENQKWWRTRRWWMQVLLWLVLFNGLLIATMFLLPPIVDKAMEAQATAQSANEQSGAGDENQSLGLNSDAQSGEEFQQDAPALLFSFASLLLPIGVIVLVQGQVLEEKNNGITAWILSKPVARPSYLLAKLLSDGFWVFLLMIVIPMIPAYFLIVSTVDVSLSSFLMGVGILTLQVLFYLVFTLMLSATMSSMSMVTGIAMGVVFGGLLFKNILGGILGQFFFLTPWAVPDVMNIILKDMPMQNLVTLNVFGMIALALVCLFAMFWHFNRQEL